MDYRGRVSRGAQALEEARLDALLVTHLPNIRYLSGFTGSAGVLALRASKSVLFTDGRYTEQAKQEVRGVSIRIVPGKPALAAAADWLRRHRARRVGIEASHLSVAERGILKGLRIVNSPPLIERLRMVKDAHEVEAIRAACRLGVQLFRRLQERVRPGVRESEAAGELEFAARKAGVDGMAFPTIIAGGERSALPHGRASMARIPARGFVVCDFGVILAGYCSDMTRTLHMGRPESALRAAYEAVREAQQAAVEAVRPGTTVGEVDQAARKLLTNNKLGRFFTHSTGHGVGLEIHEMPRLAAGQKEQLQPGMVVTIEPGVYSPGRFGVRIEDTVVVTDQGCEILTPCSKDLLALET